MEENNIDTDLSSCGPAAILQAGSSLLVIEAERGDVDVVALFGELLPANQRDSIRIAGLPSTSQIRRWVVETADVQALSALLALAPPLHRDYSIAILPEVDMGYADRVQASIYASTASWGFGARPAAAETASPTVFGSSSLTTSPATTTTGQGMDSDEKVGALAPEQLLNTQAQVNPSPPVPPVHPPAPPALELDQETISGYENLLSAAVLQLFGGIHPSYGHRDTTDQHEGKDEDELDDEELEVYARTVENLAAAGAHPSGSGGGSLEETEEEVTNLDPFKTPSSKK